MFRTESQKRKCRAYIDGEMTIYNARSLKENMTAALSDKRSLEIDLSQVTEIDCAGVQLLMLAKKERTQRKQALVLTNHSAAVLDAFELLGLVSWFNDPVVMTKATGGQHES